MTEAHTGFALDRRTIATILLLFGLALAVNADRFLAGPSGPLRAHDVADNTLTGFAACGEFWRSALRSTWDPTQLRGWPRPGSPQHPQLFMCLAGAALPAPYLFPLFHTLLLAVIAAGGFLFVRAFLQRPHEVAIAGAAVGVTLYFFFHEHPIVPSAILLPPLVGILSVAGATWRERWLLFAGAALVMGLSNPPPTLILMPVGHLALVLAVGPRGTRNAHLARWVIFWGIYGLYYLPAMLAMLREFPDSSRSLYRPPVVTGRILDTFGERILNPAVLSPAFVLVALVSRRTWRGTAWLFGGLLAFVALSAANDVMVRALGGRLPVLVSLSTTYYRMYYFIPIPLLVWAVWLFDDTRGESPRARLLRALVAAAFCGAVVMAVPDPSRVFLPYWRYAALLAVLGLALPWYTARTWRVVTALALALAIGRFEFTRIYEVPMQGNLFVEAPGFGQPVQAGRAVTVMNDCDAVDLYPAQARAAGADTLDGISNSYSAGFARRWRHFVSDNPFSCTARYAGWNTRTEVTLHDFRYNTDRIVSWLWINNVAIVRSPEPLVHPRLRLTDQAALPVDGLRDVERYLYTLEPRPGGVFAIPRALADEVPAGDLAAEERLLARLDREALVTDVGADVVSASHWRFSGSFEPDRVLLASINFHRGWRLRVDGNPSELKPEPGPFGMLQVPTVPGPHAYELVFRSPATVWIPIFMVAGLALLWAASGRRHAFERMVTEGAFPRWNQEARVALIIGAVGIVAVAGVILATSVRQPEVPWLPGGWQYRARLDTAGVPVTSALSHVPVRLELTALDGWFWKHVREDGADIRFTDPDGVTVLPHEFETFDPVRRQMVAWVAAGRFVPGPQALGYIYVGNELPPAPPAHRVWDEHYTAVWHAPPADAPLGFDVGADDWTLEFRVRPERLEGRNFGLFEQGPPGTFNLYLHSGGYLVLERQNGAQVSEVAFADQRIAPEVWTHVTISRTRHHLRLAINGEPEEARPVLPEFAHPPLSGTLKIGQGRYGPLAGALAEVRISRGLARSAGWTLSSFAAQQPGFVTLGVPEAASGARD